MLNTPRTRSTRSAPASVAYAARASLPASVRRRLRRFLGGFAPVVLTLGCLKTPDRHAQSTLDVSANPPANFELEGEPFCFAGSNNYYPIFKPRDVVDDLFESAQKLGFKVMRVWAMLDVGALDGSVPHVDPPGPKENVYLQYYDPKTQRVQRNEAENGLPRLDYVLDSAARHDVKLILVMVNNWTAFGGIDQYIVWHGRQYHHEFYADPEIKQTYKNWLDAVVTRTNSINGRLYRDDPTIFSWELANEPRAIAAGGRDSKSGWDKSTITTWADEMSAYIKSLDPNHMVSVGDEGFLDGGGTHWAYAANDGVDHKALTALEHIDFGTFHLYPEHWQTTNEWGDQWIVDHLRVARELGKPTILEEYGTKVARAQGKLGAITQGWREREQTYRRWNDIMLRRGGNGALVWMLAGKDNDGSRYPDYDRFAFWRDGPTGELLAGIAESFKTALACQAAGGTRPSRSRFVRVRGPAADHAALHEPGFWRL